ncbi:MAG: glycosyltransferase family 39 protein, partial [Anaerolineae bacterium]
MTRTSTVLVLAILLAAAAFRFYGLDWDQHIGAHPDERYIVDVASRLSLADGLNPFQAAPDLAYGHLPLYLLALVQALVPSLDPLLLGRAISATFDLGTVVMTFLLGRHVFDARVGLLGATLVALMPAHVQQARFYTPDALLASLALAALLFVARFTRDERTLDLWLAGVAAGMAVGTKAIGAILVVPLGFALSSSGGRWRAALRCGAAVLVSFLVTSPYALIEGPTFLRNLASQAAILRGSWDVPYTIQYHMTLPYVYPVMQQLRWGMGWVLGLCALGGLLTAVVGAVRQPPGPEEWLLLAWVIPFFAFVGGLYVKFPRYLLPILPVLAIYAASLVGALARLRRAVLPVSSLILVGPLLLRCLGLATMYSAPHPWLTASEWFYDHVGERSTIAVEAWDHPLPLDAEDYKVVELPVFDVETPQKWAAIDGALEEADYLVIASRRGYGSLARWPARFPRTARTYERLFKADLGFEPVACFGRYPRLDGLVLADDPTAGLPFSLPAECQPPSVSVLSPGRLD